MSIYHHNRTRSAFTLIELLIVIAIIVIIVVVVMMNFLGRRNTVDLANAAAQVTALLRQAQSASMAQESGASWTVQFQNATNTAPFYALISSVNGVSSTVGYYRLPNTVAYITSTLPLGSSLTVPFSQISGGTATSTNIGLYLISDPSQQETISISSLGAVSSYAGAPSSATSTFVYTAPTFNGTFASTTTTGSSVVLASSTAGATAAFSGTGNVPLGIAFDGTNMWTANSFSNSVTKISPTGTIIGTYSGTGNEPLGIAFDGTNMWIANSGGNSVTKISPTGTIIGTYSGTGNTPFGIAFDGTNMWTANYGGNSVTKISPTGTIIGTYSGTGSGPYSIAFDGTNMWIANSGGNSVTKISPSGATTTFSGTDSDPIDIAFDGTNMWTANNIGNSVTKISPTGTIIGTYSIGTNACPNPNPHGIAFDGTNMWTANFNCNSVTKISPSGATTTFSGAGSGPYHIAFDGTNMWTANQGGNGVTEIAVGDSYPSGIFISSPINVTSTGGININKGTLAWTSSGSGSITMQARSANSPSALSGMIASGICQFGTNGGLFSIDSCTHNGDTYIQYQATLFRTTGGISLGTLLPQANPFLTPSLNSVTITD